MPLLLLPEALASDDCVFNVFAITGYLGNAGANLPTAMTIKTPTWRIRARTQPNVII